MRRVTALVLLSSLVVALPAAAGVRLQMEHRDLGRSPKAAEASELLLDEHQLKMSRNGGGEAMGAAMLFDGQRQTMWVIDHERRSYMEMDRETVKATGGKVASAMSLMQEQLKNLPPEQRAMIEKAMKGRMGGMSGMGAPAPAPPEEEIRPTGDRAEKQGHPCRRVEIWVAGTKTREHWVTDWKELGLAPQDLAVLEELGDFIKELGSAMGLQKDMPDLMKATEEMGGVPIVTIDYSRGRAQSETVVVAVEKIAIPAADLRLPDGYARQAMPGFDGP